MPRTTDPDQMRAAITEIAAMAHRGDQDGVMARLEFLVPEFAHAPNPRGT